MNSRISTLRVLATIVLVCALGAGSASAAVVISSGGAGDGKWSTPGNWQGGEPPQNDDAVVLMDGGIVPTNVDIADLDLNYVQFSNVIQNLTLIGNDLKVNTLRNRHTNNFVNNNIIMKSSAAWDVNSPFRLTVNGSIGATGDAISLAANNSGTLVLAGTNTWAGGLKANQCTVVMYSDASLGRVPPTNVPAFIDNGAGMVFQSTGGFNRVVIHPNRGLRITGLKTITAGANVKLIMNQRIIENAGGRAINFVNSVGGVYEFGGSNTFTGAVGNNTASWLVRMKHPWALGQGTNENVALMTQGTYDLMGNSLPTRRIRGINGGGWPGVGCIMNSIPGTTSVISNGFFNSNNNGGWFGRGDFVMFGTLDFNSTGTTQPLKNGPGRLVLKNQVCLTNRVNVVNGTLVWDYSDAIQDKLPDGQTLRLEG
ncbi:hypothetical protein GX586_00985, partial [bacterium]|nr:hypothetical protein [bacterium]